LRYKKIIFFILFLSILPSFYITNASIGNIYKVNIVIDKGVNNQNIDQNDSCTFTVVAQSLGNKSDVRAIINGDYNISSILRDFKIIEVYNQSKDNNVNYSIKAEKDDVVYHISIVISAVGGRLEGVNVLENDKRRKIFAYLQSNPGSYMREIMRVHDLSPNEAQYHLATLERHSYIKQVRSSKFLLFYPCKEKVNVDQIKQNMLIKNGDYQKIYNLRLFDPKITIKEISKQTGLHRNTVSKYLKILNKDNKIGRY
jgi:DNA-binding MarR family transcriptional regulator